MHVVDALRLKPRVKSRIRFTNDWEYMKRSTYLFNEKFELYCCYLILTKPIWFWKVEHSADEQARAIK